MAVDQRDQRLNAENAVLGAMLIDESIVRSVLGVVDAGDFLNPTNRMIFQVFRKLFRSGEPVDPITVRDRIGMQYTQYLLELQEITPTSANWEVYARLMHEQAALQRIRDIADKLSEAPTLEDCRSLCADMSQLLADGRSTDAWTMAELVEDFFRSQEPDTPGAEYITLGFEEIDKGTYIEPGDVVMLGGYPSDGKTAMALMMAYHMAAKRKVGFFSLETGKEKLRDRIVSQVAQMDFGSIKRHKLTEGDWSAFSEKSADMSRRKLTVLRGSGMTVTDIQSITQAYGFEVIFLDYVQLVVPETDRRAPRSEQMADVSRSLHTFAQKSGVTVVELAQLTRAERGAWREPDMHDLKESGQFEQDADSIFLLFRPKPGGDLDPDNHRIFKIAKQKEGRRGKWPLTFDGERQTFSMLVGDDGKAVMRKMIETGKKARRQRRQEVSGQAELTELPGEEVPAFWREET